jgi:hypothetical protein
VLECSQNAGKGVPVERGGTPHKIAPSTSLDHAFVGGWNVFVALGMP